MKKLFILLILLSIFAKDSKDSCERCIRCGRKSVGFKKLLDEESLRPIGPNVYSCSLGTHYHYPANDEFEEHRCDKGHEWRKFYYPIPCPVKNCDVK